MPDDEKPVVIPGSILALLQYYWRPAQPDFSHFEANFGDTERRKDPSYYVYRKETAPGDIHPLSGREVIALSKEDLFDRFIKSQGETLSLNEHAQHAIQDFCEATYKAWAICQEQLSRIR